MKDPCINTYGVERLKEEKLKFLEAYYKIMTQIPMQQFQSVPGFNTTALVRLKMVVESINRRIKSKSTLSPPPVFASAPTPNPVQVDDFDPDQVDTDEVIMNYESAKRAEAGKSNDRYVDLTNGGESSPAFKPRIDMKGNKPILPPPESVYNTNLVESFETDDDGFPIIDFSQLEDVLPSQPTTSQAPKRSKPETVESMIPSGSGKIDISVGDKAIGKFHSGVQNDGITGKFDGFNYDFSQQLDLAFRTIFGLKTFRPNQLQAINAAMLKNDVFILMPTGGGKSLCYQLPAVITLGVTIVVSPLKSLILDQVNKLRTLDVS
jgi:bloom syndrome protein